MPQFESMPILERNSLYNKIWTLRGNAFLVEVLQEAKEEKIQVLSRLQKLQPKAHKTAVSGDYSVVVRLLRR